MPQKRKKEGLGGHQTWVLQSDSSDCHATRPLYLFLSLETVPLWKEDFAWIGELGLPPKIVRKKKYFFAEDVWTHLTDLPRSTTVKQGWAVLPDHLFKLKTEQHNT